MEPLYKSRDFDLSGLRGISDPTLESHFQLYEEYVQAANVLRMRIAELSGQPADEGDAVTLFPLIERRLAFEYNGMVLHEHYFGNLMRGGAGEPAKSSTFRSAVKASFGGYDAWRTHFVRLASMRGAGWTITCLDPCSGRLSNRRIALNEMRPLSGLAPVLVLDGWDHAYVPDYDPTEREAYVEDFFANVNWTAVDARLEARAGPIVSSETSEGLPDTWLATPASPMGS